MLNANPKTKRYLLLTFLLVLSLATLACGFSPCGLLGGGKEEEGEATQEAAGQATAAPTPKTAATPQTFKVDTAERPADGMVMIHIPVGEFLMGSDESAFAPERPGHMVTLDEYWIDGTEVTNAQYRRCVEAEVCAAPNSWNNAALSGDDQPVLVPWEIAWAYCEWAGGRLPTEAEWEKAARGTDGRMWPWGKEYEHGRANLSGPEDGFGSVAPVGSFPAGASPYGLLDMAGNAAEWVADWWDVEYYARSPAKNPTGPASGERKVSRGASGNAGGGPEKCRCTARYAGHPNWEFGFRCVFTESPDK